MTKNTFKFEALINILLFALCFSGVMLIYSSQAGRTYGFEAAELALKQTFFMLAGIIIMNCIKYIDSKKFLSAAPILAGGALLILYGVLIFGVKINGMRGWYSIGNFLCQPSEIFKFIYILFVSALYMKYEKKEKAFCFGALFTLLWTGAILLQPDYGTAMLYVFAFGIISFLAGVKLRILLLLPAAALSSLIVFIAGKEYGFNRLYGFFSENADVFGSAWHWKQFQLTIAKGSWTGNRIDGAFWSNNYLPFAYNDSAYAALHETLGVIGALFVLLMFFALLYIFYRRSLNADNMQLPVQSGIFIVIMQVLLHCSINCALVPTTGLTLPFVSYGGSSLIGGFLLLGMLMSFCRSAKENTEK